ncbi:hypothetical protein B0J13DRAFT_579349 [Dactylonectria estremocensis]|uniref:Uncharacterized protein n=1 Tax=Dactylonectria estremocensis TaxID=1079267 RepID=A0A9P9I5Z0_9HYPO|nr:hypothetical protein B0J13DRAFT_579349 [Dactylonectria estremocensis]
MPSLTSTLNSILTSTLSDTPTQFPTSDKQLIKSLNIEALSRVFLPPPPYITLPEYSMLCPKGYRSPDLLLIYFSLNLSVYNQQIVKSEWENHNSKVYKVPVILICDFRYQV